MGPRTDRPLTTALGWRLPGRLLDIGPVAFIFVVGVAALAARHTVGDVSHVVLLLGLGVITAALLVRHRAPLSVLGLALAIEVTLGWGPVVVFPVLLALFNVAEYTERPVVIGATLVTCVATIATLVIHEDQITTGTVVSRLVVIGLAVAVALYLRTRADYIKTVFLSSHLLDEVEKTCHTAAVIDQGRIIAQGPISELVRDEHNELDIGLDDRDTALDLLDGHPSVAAAHPTPDGIRITLAGIDGAAAVNARLVTGGVLVSRLEPVRESLEQRFLEMTSRVGGQS